MENKKIIEVDRERFWDCYLSSFANRNLPLSVCITPEEKILSMGFHIEDDEIEDFDELRFAKEDK